MSATAISKVFAWEVLDSRGTPTVACEISLKGGARGTASVPSGASTGTFEATELRDGGERYGGRGVSQAVVNVNTLLSQAVSGADASDTPALDKLMRDLDGTKDLSKIGANAILSVSIASALAAAEASGEPLYRWLAQGAEPLIPMPMVNIVSGGAHADAAVDLQDFLVVPVGASSFAEAIEWAWRVRRATAELVSERGLPSALVADEGGLGPPLPSNRAALELLAAGIERSGLKLGEQASIAIDVAANQFKKGDSYHFAADGRTLDVQGLIEELVSWCESFPIVSIEDAIADDDWDGWALASEALNSRTQMLGDDLFVTDSARLDRAVSARIANAVLVKPNQAGTLSAAAEVVAKAHATGYATVISARSGETEDSWLADLAIGWRGGQIKVGSTMRSERSAKWNRVLKIEAELGSSAVFAGKTVLSGLG